MALVRWEGNTVIQFLGDETAELGLIDQDPGTGKYVLWLKDPFSETYLRGENFESEQEARDNALDTPSANVVYLIWLRHRVLHTLRAALIELCSEFGPDLIRPDSTQDELLDEVDSVLKKLPMDEIKELAKNIEAYSVFARSGSVATRYLAHITALLGEEK